ncbi:MAG: hypothetical protein ABIR28_13905 [Vicinamibacteria bacterium]
MKSLLLAITLAGGAVLTVQPPIEQARTEMGPEPEARSVWTGRVVRSLSIGFSDVLADIYWLRAVQYYGRQHTAGAPTHYTDLLPLLDTAAELDPRFEIIYRYGSVFLSEPHPTGAGRPLDGVALLQKGSRLNPNSWQLRQDEGLAQFFYLNDATAASVVLAQGAEIPGAPFWMKPLAAQVLAKGGELESALQLWTILYEQSEPGYLKENAAGQMKMTQNKILARRVGQQWAAYQARTGDKETSLSSLKARGLVETDVDLAGTRFDGDPATATVTTSTSSPLWRR